MTPINAVKFPTAQESREMSESNSKPTTAYSLMESTALIRASIRAACEAGRKSTTIRLPVDVGSEVKDLLTKTFRNYGYRVRVTSSQGYMGEGFVFQPRTYIHLFW